MSYYRADQNWVSRFVKTVPLQCDGFQYIDPISFNSSSKLEFCSCKQNNLSPPSQHTSPSSRSSSRSSSRTDPLSPSLSSSRPSSFSPKLRIVAWADSTSVRRKLMYGSQGSLNEEYSGETPLMHTG